MNISFIGSSLTSAYWNGAATYYRGIIQALHRLGHHITFYESDFFDRQNHRDLTENPDWVEVVVYHATEEGSQEALEGARESDIVIKASGLGTLDEWWERAVLTLKSDSTRVLFWDVDAPATLDRVAYFPDDYFRDLIPQYDLIFTYGGGDPVVQKYKEFGAQRCVPIYNALDPDTHKRAEPDPSFMADLAFMGNRMPDREERVHEFFFRPARLLSSKKFLLGGSGWEPHLIPENVKWIGHIYTRDHNAFNSSPLALLNICRESMARYGHSPATRVFEAAGAGACVITDYWEGLDEFFELGSQWLAAKDGAEVAEILESLDPARARQIGHAAQQHVLKHHTYEQRAKLVEEILNEVR